MARSEDLTPEVIEAAVERVLDRRSPTGDAVQAGVNSVQELTLSHLSDAFSQAQSVLTSRVDELVGRAMEPALREALAPIRAELTRLQKGVDEAKTVAASTKQELEGKMRTAEAAVAALGADLAANSAKTNETATKIDTFLGDLDRQRRDRETKEKEERERRERREAEQDERFRAGAKWAIAFGTTISGGLLINILFTALARGSLPTDSVDRAVGAVVVLLILAFIVWWRTGFRFVRNGKKAVAP